MTAIIPNILLIPSLECFSIKQKVTKYPLWFFILSTEKKQKYTKEAYKRHVHLFNKCHLLIPHLIFDFHLGELTLIGAWNKVDII